MDRLLSMSVFVRAVDLGSFSAAAAALDLSGPMVGKHVRALEERLGVRLINRTTRRQSLTDVGRVYYDRCRVVLAEADAADAAVADDYAEPRGTLRVTMPVLFGRNCVAPVLLRLAHRHAGLELDLSFTDRLADLADERWDLAIRTGVLEDRAGVMTRRVARQKMIVCASPAYLEKHRPPHTLEDIGTHQAIVYRRAGQVRPWLFPRFNEKPAEIWPTSRWRFDDMDAIADAAADGLGLAWLPSWLVRGRVRAGTLVPVLEDHGSFPYDCHALWLAAPRMPLKIRLTIDALAAELPALTT